MLSLIKNLKSIKLDLILFLQDLTIFFVANVLTDLNKGNSQIFNYFLDYIDKNYGINRLDIFEGLFTGTILAEVEFPTIEAANSYTAPSWFIDYFSFLFFQEILLQLLSL